MPSGETGFSMNSSAPLASESARLAFGGVAGHHGDFDVRDNGG